MVRSYSSACGAYASRCPRRPREPVSATRHGPRRQAVAEPVEYRILAVNVGERLEHVLLASARVVHAIGQVAGLEALAEPHA